VHKAIADGVGVVPVLRVPAVIVLAVIVGVVPVANVGALVCPLGGRREFRPVSSSARLERATADCGCGDPA
jgi:hypothetical protein